MDDIRPELNWVEHPDLIEFYSSERMRPEDLYPSESRFLPALAAKSESILDVGCGSGGFADIWAHYNPSIKYTGVDASAGLLDAARIRHPDVEFERADAAARLPFADASFETVAALGWLPVEPRYRKALPELWRVTQRYLFIDARLQDSSAEDLVGRQRIVAPGGDWDGKTTSPYIVAPWADLASALLALNPVRLFGYGYEGKPRATVVNIDAPICFATFVLERGTESAGTPEVALDLPLEWPDGLQGSLRPLADGELRPPLADGELRR